MPGTDDQVDVNVTVEETSAGSFTFGLGYSQVEKLIASVSVSENNFLGTGDAASATVQKSYYLTRYNLNYYQPYLTPDGIGLGYDANYSKLDSAQINIANYFNNTAAFSTFLGLPITETDARALVARCQQDQDHHLQRRCRLRWSIRPPACRRSIRAAIRST